MIKKNTQSELAALLDKNDYRVVVQATDGGCMTSFPARTESPILSFVRLYQEFTPNGILLCEYDENGVEIVVEEIECPIYAQRLFTIYQILFQCLYIDYSSSLVKFMVRDEEIDENEFIQLHNHPLFVDEEHMEREIKLKELISACSDGGFQPLHTIEAENAGILDGFIAIHNIFMPNQIEEENNE